MLIPTEYGGRMIYCGEIDRGMAILQDAVGFGAVLPSWSHFALFVGYYMRGDIAEARYHASQLTSETYVYGQLARALIAHATVTPRKHAGPCRRSVAPARMGQSAAARDRQADQRIGDRGPACG